MKIYKVIFNQYTNGVKNTVYNEKDNSYIRVDNFTKDQFLITEKQLIEIQKYGNGIKEMIFLGNLWEGNEY